MHERRPLVYFALFLFAATLPVVPLSAALLRVGPGGTHATIQAAIDAAMASPEYDFIAIRRGVYHENLRMRTLTSSLTISGGYDAAFEARTGDPAATVIDGAGLGRVMDAVIEGPHSLGLILLSFVKGQVVAGEDDLPHGVGLRLDASGGALVDIMNCQFRGNQGLGPSTGIGGGAFIRLTGASLGIHDSGFHDNRLATDEAEGGALAIATFEGRNHVTIRNSEFTRNRTEYSRSTGSLFGAALTVRLNSNGNTFEFTDSVLTDNGISFPGLVPLASALAVLADAPLGTGTHLHRLRFERNTGGPHVFFQAARHDVLNFYDSLLVGGSRGIDCRACAGLLRLTNLTIADNGSGVFVDPGFVPSGVGITNSIVFRNGTGIDAPPGSLETSNNLVGIDPLFIDAAASDYHLLPGSPAVDTGDDTAALRIDLDGRPRVQGAHVDIGAYETEPGSAGAPSNACVVRGFGVVPFVPALSGACRCFRDAGLRELRCGFFLPELFLDAALPFPLLPGQPVETKWVLHPWQGPEGPYEMKLEILSKGQWMPLVGRGKPTGKLALDKLVGESFAVVAPQTDAPVRASIRHLAPGPNGPGMVEDVVYMLVDVATIGEQP